MIAQLLCGLVKLITYNSCFKSSLLKLTHNFNYSFVRCCAVKTMLKIVLLEYHEHFFKLFITDIRWCSSFHQLSHTISNKAAYFFKRALRKPT